MNRVSARPRFDLPSVYYNQWFLFIDYLVTLIAVFVIGKNFWVVLA